MKIATIRTAPNGPLVLFLSLACLALAPFDLGAQASRPASAGANAEVPDIETRIRNTGSAVPAAAIPAIPAPAPAALPSAPETPAASVPAASEPTPAPADNTAPAPVSEAASEPARANPVTGSVRLGAGNPGTLLGDLSVRREEGTLPALALDFSYASADGYGREKSGTGFFDRAAVARFGASASSWFAGLSLFDRTDGFQEKNPRYYALTRRDVGLSAGLRSLALGSPALTLSVLADGTVDSAFAEGPSSGGRDDDAEADAESRAAKIDGFSGYRLSPALELAFAKGSFLATLTGRYGYETARDEDEMHDGSGDLSLRYGIGNLNLLASAGVAGDGGSGSAGDGIVFPFSVGLVWNPGSSEAGAPADAGAPANTGTPANTGAPRVPREVRLSFGITRERQSARTLADGEPFADPSGLSVFSADWDAELGFAIGTETKNGSVLSARADAEYRKSLAGHGALALTDALTGASLVALRRVERDSLVTGAGLDFAAPSFSLGAGYEGEWLDRLDRRSLHALTVGANVFDRGVDRVWEAGVQSSFALDRAEYPALSAHGTVRPFRNFAVTLSAFDVLPLAAGEARTRNGLYATRSGEITLSAKLDF